MGACSMPYLNVLIVFFVGTLLACNENTTKTGSIGTESITFTNIAYASLSTDQVMDIFIPEGQGPFPAVVYIHGGGFFTGSKRAGKRYAKLLVENGYVGVSINYRLSGEATFPAAVQDAKAAVRFLRANAKTYRIDANNIGSWGSSAGGNLASMLGTSSGDAYTEDLTLGNEDYSSHVSATVNWFGPINFATIVEEAIALGHTRVNTNLEEDYMGFSPLTVNLEEVARANPASYISADDAAFFIQAGSKDPLIPYSQSENFYKELVEVLGEDRVSFELLQGARHGGRKFNATPNLKKVIAFFDQHLK